MKIDKTLKLLAVIAAMATAPLTMASAQMTPEDVTGANAVPVAQAVPVGAQPVTVGAQAAAPGTVQGLPANNIMQNAPTGTPSIVGEVMDNLQQTQSSMSVNDLAKAQDALVRLDMMLKIEQKLNDLKKAQDDRNAASAMPIGAFGVPNMGGAMPMVGQVPAGALAAPAGIVVDAAPPVHHKKQDTTDVDDYTVEQVMGVNGNLTAVLLTPDGDRKNVRVGDSVGNRMKVAAITTNGVELRGPKGKSKTIDLDNDGVVLAPLSR